MVKDTASAAASAPEERQVVTRSRRSVRILVGTLTSLCCLVLVLRGVQWEVLASALGSMRLLSLLAAVAVEFLAFWAIATRWQRLFSPHTSPPQGRFFGRRVALAALDVRRNWRAMLVLAGAGVGLERMAKPEDLLTCYLSQSE